MISIRVYSKSLHGGHAHVADAAFDLAELAGARGARVPQGHPRGAPGLPLRDGHEERGHSCMDWPSGPRRHAEDVQVRRVHREGTLSDVGGGGRREAGSEGSGEAGGNSKDEAMTIVIITFLRMTMVATAMTNVLEDDHDNDRRPRRRP